MSFAVGIYWENPPGTRLTSLQFDPGQPMHLSVQVRGIVGAPEPGLHVTVDIFRTSGEAFSPIFLSGTTNLLGNVDWDFIIPSVIARAQVIVSTYPVIGSVQEDKVNIGIGEAPAPQPHAVDWTKVAIWAGVAVGVGLLGYAAFKLAQSRKPQQLVLMQPPQKVLTKP